MSSLSRRYRQSEMDGGELMPPDLSAIGAVSFGDAQRARLSAWLREAGWPRAHMELPELEGYLTALIAWPVGIAPGAWLPPIWGERGWKVPRKIGTRPQYEEFVALIIGFMQELDLHFSRQPARLESSSLRTLEGRDQVAALRGWGRGFMRALTLGSQGLKARGDSARTAVRAIAIATSASAMPRPRAAEEVMEAAVSLVKQRASRGPLGPLDVVTIEL